MIFTHGDGGEKKGFNTVPDNREENPTVGMPPITDVLIQKRRTPDVLQNTTTTEYNPEISTLLGSSSLKQLITEVREKASKKMMIAQDATGERTMRSMTYEDLLKSIRQAIKSIDSNSQNPLKALQEVPSFSFDSESWGANFRKVLLELYVKAKNNDEGKQFIKDFIAEA